MRVTRLGAVSYLNTQPLVWGIERDALPGRFDLRRAVPSRCAASLAAGEVDLALLPSIEFARQAAAAGESLAGGRSEGMAAVPGLCISSDGAAASVLLFSRVPFDRIRSVGVDEASRTSVALLRILLRERWSNDPPFTETAREVPRVLESHDAALVIGDRALFAERGSGDGPADLAVADLGVEWKALTGLPFVFAFWSGRRGAAGPEEVAALQASLASGLDHLPDIAASWRWNGAPRPRIVLPYLRDVMRYRWGQPERDGLLRFWLLAARHGLIDEVPDLSFFPQPVGVAGPAAADS